jgi:hypothetical protein
MPNPKINGNCFCVSYVLGLLMEKQPIPLDQEFVDIARHIMGLYRFTGTSDIRIAHGYIQKIDGSPPEPHAWVEYDLGGVRRVTDLCADFPSIKKQTYYAAGNVYGVRAFTVKQMTKRVMRTMECRFLGDKRAQPTPVTVYASAVNNRRKP